MTNEERDLISRFIERVAGAGAAGTAAAPSAPLPPVDREADALIADLFSRYPDVRYRMTQTAFVQEHALIEAQNRIARLQQELQAVRQAQTAPPPSAGSPWGAAGAQAPQPPAQQGGFFSSLFGGGRPAPAAAPQYAPPPPQYPQGYNPGMLQQQGPGFFGSALRTAAGVAGGVVAADALMGLFSGHQGGGGWGGGTEQAGFSQAGFENPWGSQSNAGPDPYDAGGAPKDFSDNDKFAGPAQVDQSAWTPAPDQGGGGWQDSSNQDSGGWQDASDQGGDSGGGGWDDTQNT